MASRQDNNLDFFAKCSSADLDTLVTILTKDKDGKLDIKLFLLLSLNGYSFF
jgi:hypothetical protein